MSVCSQLFVVLTIHIGVRYFSDNLSHIHTYNSYTVLPELEIDLFLRRQLAHELVHFDFLSILVIISWNRVNQGP